jgi:formylglycine-generating enzyme required for sulfatase activity
VERRQLPRLFISHSSKDNVPAKAFKLWLGKNGWPDEDVFLDVDDIDAGERWKEALLTANLQCEAIILLASPEALSSPECLAEIRKAEDYGKAIIVVLLRDLQVDDRRLDTYKERQIVDLAATPLDHVELVQFRGEQHEVRFNGKALARIRDYLLKRGITPDYFPWPPRERPDAAPFPGLSAFGEGDAGIFFGRDADILRGLDSLRIVRRDRRPRTLVIQAASGAGKSSFLRAGLWPRLERDPDFTPLAIIRPAHGAVTGPDGLGHKLAARLSRRDRVVNAGDLHAQLMASDLAEAIATLKASVAEITAQAHDQRQLGDANARPPALIIAVDQAEELLGSEDGEEGGRLIELLAGLLLDPPPGVEPFAILTIRGDSAAQLFQLLSDRDLDVPETLPLLPLPRTSYRDVILKPLDVLARRGKALTMTPELVERLASESAGADALPLLAFTLSSLYKDFGETPIIALEQYETLGGVAGSIDRALKRALSNSKNHPAIPSSNQAQLECLREAFIPWLARISPETGLPMRRVARRDEFSGDSLAMVERLTQARLLVADRREGVDVVEIAHESLLRQWHNLTDWLAKDADNLRLIEGVEQSAAEWTRNRDRRKERLEHRSTRLRAAEKLVNQRPDYSRRLGEEGLAYLRACRADDRRRSWALRSTIGGLVLALALGGLAWWYEAPLTEVAYKLTNAHPLSADSERSLTHADVFQECTDCPKMVALRPGTFTMGAVPGESDASGREYEPHEVTIAREFAVAETPVTFAQFSTCARFGDCDDRMDLNTDDDLPAVNVTWADAQRYAAWLSRITGKSYRLLSEAEYEYATRGGTTSRYPWGDEVRPGKANCGTCDTGLATPAVMPVGSFPANEFGLHDMVGNVFQWVEDCIHDNYDGAPADGSAWKEANCKRHVVRGASWLSRSSLLRSSWRDWRDAATRNSELGFRVARVVVQ